MGRRATTFNGGALTAGRTASLANDIAGTLNLNGGTIGVVSPTASGTLTMSGSLNMNSATYAYFPGDRIAVGGALTLGGANSLLLSSSIAPATYTLSTFSGALPNAANISMGGDYQSGTRQSFVFNSSGSALTLTVTGAAANLQWNTTSGTWDNQLSQSWYNATSSSADVFYSADTVNFTDRPGGSAAAVNINASVAPIALVVNNTAVNYTFNGSGSIIGTTSLIKNGTGSADDQYQQHLFGRHGPQQRSAELGQQRGPRQRAADHRRRHVGQHQRLRHDAGRQQRPILEQQLHVRRQQPLEPGQRRGDARRLANDQRQFQHFGRGRKHLRQLRADADRHGHAESRRHEQLHGQYDDRPGHAAIGFSGRDPQRRQRMPAT